MMLPTLSKFSSRIHKLFSFVALFGALLSAGFLSAKYELKIKHDPKTVTLTFANDGHPGKPLVMHIDDKTHTFADRDYMHELLEIEEDGTTGIKIAFKDNKNELSGVLYHDDKNGNHLDIKKLILDEDMGITTNGDLTFSKGVHSKKMIALTAKNIRNNCTFEAKNIVIKGRNETTVTNNALLKASEGISIKNVTLHNQGIVEGVIGTFIDQTTLINDYILKSNGAIDIRDGALRNHGTITTLSTLACYGPILEQTGTLQAPMIIINQPQVAFENKGVIASSDTTEITALNILNHGTITGALKTDAQGETFNKHCLLKAHSITNNGTMLGGEKFELQATKEILNYGIWTTNKQFSATAPMVGNFKATLKERNEDQGIHGDGSLTVDCDTFINALDAQFAIKGDVNLTARTKAYNDGLWHSDGNQQLTVGELEIETNHILEMNGNGTITCKKNGTPTCKKEDIDADGKVFNKGLLAVNGNGIFNCSNFYNDGTTWTKGTMSFNVPCAFENRQTGRIESNGYLTIDATNFLNNSGFIFGHNGGRINADSFKNEMFITDIYAKAGPSRECSGIFRGCNWRWAERHTYKASNPPIIAIDGPLKLELNFREGTNKAGIIASQNDMLITFVSSLKNESPVHETLATSQNGGWPDGLTYDQGRYPSAFASSSGNIKVTGSNAACDVKNSGENCNSHGNLKNEGNFFAKKNIEFTGNGFTNFYNGLSQSSNAIVIQENAYSRNIAIIPLEDPRNKYVYVKSTDPNAQYQFDHALIASPQEQIDSHQFVYLNDGKPYKGVPRRFISPTIEAEGFQQALAMLGRWILPGYETVFDMMLGMKRHGAMIGFVHGKPQAIGENPLLDAPKAQTLPQQENYALSTASQAELQALNTMYGGTKTIQELEQDFKKLSDGKHISTLTQEQIDVMPYPFPYLARYKDTNFVIPVYHLPKEYQDKLWRMPGTLEAGGVVQVIKFAEAENTGQILGNQIIVRAKKFTNSRRTTSHIESVEQSRGWLSSSKTIRYEVITPEQLGGDMIAGVSIEILTHDDIVNQGGTIMSVDVLMKSTDGSIINKNNPITKVIKWDTGFWGNAFGTQSFSLAMGFQPGVILAAGNLQMLSPTQKIINEASTIVAKHAKLQGYLGILSKTLANVHTASASTSHSWFAFKSEKSEAYSTGPSIMDFNDVELNSEKGSFHGVGAQFKAKKAMFNTQNNIFEPVTVTLHHKSSEGGVRGFEVFGSRTNMQQTVAIPTVLQIDEALIKAAIDNTMEAVFMVGTDGGKAKFIHFVAGRDNIFKGTHQTTTTDTNSFSMGVSFFGSEAAKSLLNGRVKEAFVKLAQEDPLVRSLEALKNAQDWQDKTGASAHVAVEALRLLVDRVESAQAGQSFKNFMGQRYGITDAQGNFAPALRFRCSFTQSSSSVDQTVPSFVHVKDIIVDSSRNIDILDGSKIKGDNVTLRGEALHMTSGTTVQTMMQTMLGYSASFAGKNLASVGIDFADGHAESTTHSNAEVEASNTLIVKVKDLMARGGVLLGDIVDLSAVNMCFESVQDITDQKMVSGGASIGLGYEGMPDVGGGFARNAHDSTLTNQRSKVRARSQLIVDATGKLKLVGANLEVEGDKPGSYVKTPLLEVYDLNDHSHTHQLAASISTSLASSVKALADFNLQRKWYKAKQHSMISQNIDLQADKTIGDKFVRNAEEQIEVIEDGHSHWRIVAPIIGTKRVGNALRNVGDLFKNKAPQQSSYADFKKAFESVEHEASEATGSTSETAQQTTSSESDKTPSNAKLCKRRSKIHHQRRWLN